MSTHVVEIDGRTLMLSELDSEPWPEAGLHRSDLVDYYLAMAEHVLPGLANRPLSLLRWSDDLYYKTPPPGGLPPWVPTPRIRGEHTALGASAHVVCNDRATLIHLVNLGYISHHPWSCTVDALDHPDQLRFDLDPARIAFSQVRNAAMLIRDLLAQFRLKSWVKTSGGAGLHVLVPLAPVHSFDEVLTAGEMIARMARTREPSLFTLDMRRARRHGKILIDVHRNHRGATLISPYSVREPMATVSAPLEWPELTRPVYPEDFHVKNIADRLRRQGDPLRGFYTKRQELTSLLERSRIRRASATAAR
jgi:bifunctional non-homologous end joining protein LigD